MHGDRCDSFHCQCGADDADGSIFHAGYLLYLQSCRSADICGTFFFVWSGTITGSYQILLEEEDYSVKNKQSSGRRKQVSKIYWRSVTAIYLAVSFLTNRWDVTWIIWVCAGVLCGAVSAIMSREDKLCRAQSGGSQQMTAL